MELSVFRHMESADYTEFRDVILCYALRATGGASRLRKLRAALDRTRIERIERINADFKK